MSEEEEADNSVTIGGFHRLNKPVYESGDEDKFVLHHQSSHLRFDPDVRTIESCQGRCKPDVEPEDLEDITFTLNMAGISSSSVYSLGTSEAASIRVCKNALVRLPEIVDVLALFGAVNKPEVIFLVKPDEDSEYNSYFQFGPVLPEVFAVDEDLPIEWRARIIRDTVLSLMPEYDKLPANQRECTVLQGGGESLLSDCTILLFFR